MSSLLNANDSCANACPGVAGAVERRDSGDGDGDVRGKKLGSYCNGRSALYDQPKHEKADDGTDYYGR